MSKLPAPAPAVSPETAAFWEATTAGRLVLPRCRSCGTVIWYPRALCPECHSTDIEWIDASGRGVVYSFTVSRRGEGEYREAAPYVLAYVELDEGPRVLTNLVDVKPVNVTVGMPVVATYADTGAGAALVRFRPATEETT
jgi:uncharacterized OB-fold protein